MCKSPETVWELEDGFVALLGLFSVEETAPRILLTCIVFFEHVSDL